MRRRFLRYSVATHDAHHGRLLPCLVGRAVHLWLYFFPSTLQRFLMQFHFSPGAGVISFSNTTAVLS